MEKDNTVWEVALQEVSDMIFNALEKYDEIPIANGFDVNTYLEIAVLLNKLDNQILRARG